MALLGLRSSEVPGALQAPQFLQELGVGWGPYRLCGASNWAVGPTWAAFSQVTLGCCSTCLLPCLPGG